MKTCVIYHSRDLDGWMSAAIILKWYRDNHHTHLINNIDTGDELIGFNESVINEKEINSIDFIGYHYNEPIPDLSQYDKVIMVDVSFPALEMLKISSKLIWIDHHISAIKDVDGIFKEHNYNIKPLNGLRDTKFAACELTWQYFFPNKPMPEIVRLLGRYDCFGHKGTDEEQKVLEFQYGARQAISNYEEAYTELLYSLQNYPIKSEIVIHENGKAIYQYLCTEAKQVYSTGFVIKFIDEITDNKGRDIIRRKFICINKERFNTINFGIDYHVDGYDGQACFHYANGVWNFSLYSQTVDCSVIVKQYGGGGHKGAAGFIIKDINQIIK